MNHINTVKLMCAAYLNISFQPLWISVCPIHAHGTKSRYFVNEWWRVGCKLQEIIVNVSHYTVPNKPTVEHCPRSKGQGLMKRIWSWKSCPLIFGTPCCYSLWTKRKRQRKSQIYMSEGQMALCSCVCNMLRPVNCIQRMIRDFFFNYLDKFFTVMASKSIKSVVWHLVIVECITKHTETKLHHSNTTVSLQIEVAEMSFSQDWVNIDLLSSQDVLSWRCERKIYWAQMKSVH